MSEPTYWNGKRVHARRALVRVPQHDPNNELHPPMAWWAGITQPLPISIAQLGLKVEETVDLQNTVVSAVVIWHNDVKHMSILYNGDGSGWRKVTEGHGGPRWGHRDLPVDCIVEEWLD